jgi:probable selenium-dependent hydroxylase accessory protein YqeC
VESLSAWFERGIFGENCGPGGRGSSARVITFIGSGGKTSLIWHLARHFSSQAAPELPVPSAQENRRILVSTSTKMYPPETRPPGVSFEGSFNRETGKLEALPPGELERLSTNYDLVLIEGDGSRELPLKGWADYEPVVPGFTTMTVGIIPVWPLDLPASETIVHRLPLFCALTGALAGEALKPEHLVKAIAGQEGQKSLFSAARGKRILFFNQVEDEEALARAQELASLLPVEFCGGLCAIIAGSVKQDRLTALRYATI